MSDLPQQLREYAGNPGYSHGDYADMMRQAADEIDRLSAAAASAVPAPPTGHSDAARDVLAERQRQMDVEGWTLEHDDQDGHGEMARAAAAYALAGSSDGRTVGDELTPSITERLWPWEPKWWRPTNRRRNLVKAGALILAEIERLDRATPAEAPKAGQI